MSLLISLIPISPAISQIIEESSVGRARFKAEYSVIYFPTGVSKLFLDTVDCPTSCKENLPAWRFIGELKVDSLERNGIIELLVSESQMDSIDIFSQSLQDCLYNDKVFVLAKRVPSAIPYDTLVYNTIRQKEMVVPDMSKHYFIAFSDSLSVDSVTSHLNQVQGLVNIGGYAEVMVD